MEEEDPLGALIEGISDEYLTVNGKRIKIVDGTLWVSQDDIINKYVIGFNRLHKKFEVILASSKESKHITLDKLLRFLANATLVRLSHIEDGLRVPRFIAKQIYQTLVDTEACVMANGALRKSKNYHAVIKDLSTRASMVKRKHWFILPPEYPSPGSEEKSISEMTLQELYQLREQVEKHGTPEQLEIVDKHIAIKKQERKDEEQEKVETIMKERGISRERARMVLITQEEEEEQRAYDETEENKEGGDIKLNEWYSDEMESESEIEKREEKEKAQRKKRKAITKKKKK